MNIFMRYRKKSVDENRHWANLNETVKNRWQLSKLDVVGERQMC